MGKPNPRQTYSHSMHQKYKAAKKLQTENKPREGNNSVDRSNRQSEKQMKQ